jgi:ornithine cyclodeaminase
LAARYLALESFDTAGSIGAGGQARFQMMALKQFRGFRRLMIYSIIPDEVDRHVEEMAPILGVEILKAPDVDTVVRHSDVVATCTPARESYLRAEWLHPGLHITAMGTDSEHKQELFAEAVGRADLLVCDTKT